MSDLDPNPILFEHAPEAILLLNKDGQVMSLNREACRMLSLGPEAVVGKPVLAHVIPDDRDRVKDLFLRVLSGQDREWISRFKRGDSVTRSQWVRAIPVGGDGVVNRIVMFTRDVTESRAGRPETFQLRNLLENLPGQLVAVVDRDGRVRYSSGLSRTHFRDDVESLGSFYLDLLEEGAENERLYRQMMEEVLAGRDWGGTHRHERVDGTVFPLRTFASPYRDPRSGRLLGALVAGRDASAEYEWRARAERAQRLADIGELVDSVAAQLHEATRRMEAALVEGASDYGDTQAFPRELSRMKALAGDLMAFASDARPAPERLALPTVLRAVLEEMAPWLSAHRATPTVQVAVDLPTVHADATGVRRILRTLVENAVEATRSGAVPEIHISMVDTLEGVRIEVSDTGSGVDPEDLHRLFEPFFSTKEGRAGLGLAIARTIVLAHGGHIRAECLDRGTTLIVDLPFEAPESSLRFRPAPLALSQERSVLVVDDEPSVRVSIRRFLEKVGFEVREAWSGRSALAQITAGSPPEMVLTDLKMSDGSGAWFLEQLSRDFPDLLRRTVVVTGDPDQEAVQRLTRETGCPVLRKPLEMAYLLDVLDEVAARA